MKSVHRVINSTRRRLVLLSTLGASTRALAAIVVTLVIARALQKVIPTIVFDWSTILIACVPIAIVIGLVWSIARRPSRLGAARIIDEHASLRETLSSAVIHEEDQSPWARALREDADTSASKVRVAQALPFQLPSSWRAVAIAAALLAAVWYLPTRDLTGLLQKQQDQAQQQALLSEVEQKVESAQETIERIKQETGLELDLDETDFSDEDLLNPESAEFIEPEESLRSAVKNLTAVADAIEERRESEDGRANDAIREALQGIEPKEDDPGADLARALSNGDFDAAKQELEKLKQAAQDPGMSADERSAVSQALRSIEQQLDQASENAAQFQEQLQDAGLSQQEAQSLASDPNALQQRLEELGMSQRQAREMAREAQAQQNAADSTSAMSQAVSQMAQGAENNDPSQSGEGAQNMSEQLSNLEQLQSEMQSLDSALSQTQQELSALSEDGSGSQGGQQDAPQGQGNQPGGFNAGQGGIPNLASHNDPDADYTLTKEQAKVRVNEGGPIIASSLVYGSQVRGESNAAFSEAAKAANAQASEAIETRRVPRRYEGAVRKYFGELEAQETNTDTPSEPSKSESSAETETNNESSSD